MTLVSTSAKASGGGGGDFALIANGVLAADGAIDITSIAGTYKHLRLILYLRSDYSGANFDTAQVRFNNDSSSNYDYGFDYNGASSGGGSGGLAPGVQLQCCCAGSDASCFSSHDHVLPFYANTSGYKAITGTSWQTRSVNSAFFTTRNGGSWHSTSVISRITLVPVNGTNWKAGSSYTLYGLS